MNEVNIFDFDDTLFFTNDVLYWSYNKAIKQITNKELPRDIWNKYHGGNFCDFCNELKITDKNILSKIHELKYKIYPNECLNQIKWNNNVDFYLNKEYNNYICTNSKRTNIKKILNHHNKLHFFSDIIDIDDVIKGKPNPDIYLKVIVKHKLYEYNFINIFEDSIIGLNCALHIQKYYRNIRIFKVDEYGNIKRWQWCKCRKA